MQREMTARLRAALPHVRAWIDEYLAAHAAETRTVSSIGWQRLGKAYPAELLEGSKVALVPSVPFPPAENFGLPEFAVFQQKRFDGITFKDTFFYGKVAKNKKYSTSTNSCM